MDERPEAAPGLVDYDLEELFVFCDGTPTFGDDERTPEAQLDVPSHIMPYGGLVETPEICGERRHQHVAHPAHVLSCPFFGLVLPVIHSRSVRVRIPRSTWTQPPRARARLGLGLPAAVRRETQRAVSWHPAGS